MRFQSRKRRGNPRVRQTIEKGRNNPVSGQFGQRRPFSDPRQDKEYENTPPSVEHHQRVPLIEAHDESRGGKDAKVQDASASVFTYTISNLTTDRTYDADATTLAEVADILGTLITDLKRKKSL